MIRKYLIKTTKLSKNELKEIKNLSIISHNIDGFKTKLYWNILEDRKLPEYDDFLLYIEGNLAAYIGVFAFKEDEVELSAIVHPKHRQQGHFKSLLSEVFAELTKRNFKKCLIICNREAEIAMQIVKKLNTTFSHSEYEMVSQKPVQFPNLPSLELREFTHDDIVDLAQMDAICFNSSLDKMIFRFVNSMNEKNRKVYVALSEGEKIGKVHLRFDDKNHAYIHDLCILPVHRRKKFATAMVLKIMEMLQQKKINRIYLDVEGDNTSAIKLYEQCGYEITAIHDFWAYEIP
ncbi:MAG: GNAT family N-acetyltransferase [Gammaproteobacteria bacterium]|nr:GNAT family N-acetyltransferase [Gammaproteobacteria bacterium]